MKLFTPLILSLLGTGCATVDGPDDGHDEHWQGSTPHFAAEGYLDGELLDLEIAGEDAKDVHRLSCEREYEVPIVDGAPDFSQAVVVEMKIIAVFDATQRYLELEFKRHATDQDSPGDAVTVVPRVDGIDPAADEMWFEWEWHLLDGEDLYESAAQSGVFELGEFTGTPDSDGIIPEGEGTFGGYFSGQWSIDETINLSFTAVCDSNKIEEVE